MTRTDHTLTSPDGVELTIRVHRSVDAPDGQPIVVWLHGGGMVAGTYLIDDIRFDKWCPAFGVVGVAVDYGLAPERPYPGPLEDCYTALRWAHDHAEEIGGDPDHIGIGGNSAGGGLAAGLGLLARDRGEVAVAWQALVYPMIDDRMTTRSSGWDVPVWPPVANDFGWSAYLSGVGGRGAADVPAYAAPARADGPRRAATDVHQRRCARRLPRRGPRLRHPPAARRRADRAARLPRCPARLRPDGARHADGPPCPPPPRRVDHGARRLNAVVVGRPGVDPSRRCSSESQTFAGR